MTVREAILQENEELDGMKVVCVKSKSKMNHVGE